MDMTTERTVLDHPPLDDATSDELESRLGELERLRRQTTAAMVALIGEVDRRQIPLGDGCRTTAQWLMARLDVPTDEARMLASLATSLPDLPVTSERLAAGDIGAARAHAISRVATDSDEESWFDRIAGFDLSGAERCVARHRRISRRDERKKDGEAYLWIQPSLDEAWWRIRGGLGPVAGRTVSEALRERAEELPPDAGPFHHRQALALEQLCLGEGSDADGVSITGFVDIEAAQGTNGEAGAELAYGPRLGPAALEELMCEAKMSIVGLQHGIPVVTSPRTARIPPAVRDFVMWRDGGCRAPGCTSRHRLQPHHIVPRSHGGGHHPDNLITLCWYHHHVVVHRRGYRIERDRNGGIRFVLPADSRDPP